MSKEGLLSLPQPTFYAGYPPELQTSTYLSTTEKLTNKAIYRALFSLSRNIAISRGLEEGEGLVPIFDILETGLGTDRARAFLSVTGLSEEHKGQQVPLSETHLKIGMKIKQKYKIIGIALLKEFFPGQFVSGDEIEALLKITENKRGKVVPVVESARAPINYIKNRLEIQKAIKEDDVLNKIGKLYGDDYLDAFSQRYRVGKYEKAKSEGVVGTNDFFGAIGFNGIERVEAFLDTFASGRYQFNFTADRERPPLLWEKAKLWAEHRLRDQYRNNLLIERIERELKIKGKYTPEQYALMNIWLKLYKKFPDHEESKTVRAQVIAEFNREHPGAHISDNDFWAVKALFLGERPEYAGRLETYSRRKKLQSILQNDEQRIERAQKLRTIISETLEKYHLGGRSMSDLSLELKSPEGNLGKMRTMFERLMGYHFKRNQKDESVVNSFEKNYWPIELTDFPESFKRVLDDCANPLQNLSFDKIIRKHSLPVRNNQLGEVISFILGEIPERIRKHEFEYRKRNYYWRRFKSALTVTPFIRDHLTARDQDLGIFEMSAQAENSTKPKSINQLGRENHTAISQMLRIISRVMAEMEHLFGPIPETVLEEIKDQCSY